MKTKFTVANIKRYKKQYFKNVSFIPHISVLYSKVVCMNMTNLEEKVKAQAEAKEEFLNMPIRLQELAQIKFFNN